MVKSILKYSFAGASIIRGQGACSPLPIFIVNGPYHWKGPPILCTLHACTHVAILLLKFSIQNKPAFLSFTDFETVPKNLSLFIHTNAIVSWLSLVVIGQSDRLQTTLTVCRTMQTKAIVQQVWCDATLRQLSFLAAGSLLSVVQHSEYCWIDNPHSLTHASTHRGDRAVSRSLSVPEFIDKCNMTLHAVSCSSCWVHMHHLFLYRTFIPWYCRLSL